MGPSCHSLGNFSRWDAVAALSWAVFCTTVGVVGGSAFAEDPLFAVILGMTIALSVAGAVEVVRHVRQRSGTTPPTAGAVAGSLLSEDDSPQPAGGAWTP